MAGVPTFSTRLTALLALDDESIAERCRSIALLHDGPRPRAVVLLHGMSASPAQFERFAHDLFERGFNVLVPRLPRHGERNRLTNALEGLNADELVAAVREYVAIGRELGERVTVAGFSLGGLLAAWSAQHESIERAVAIAPFFGIAVLPNRWMNPLAELMLRLPNRFHWWDPVKRARQTPDHGYPRYATHAVAHAYRLARGVLRDAAHTAPLAHHVTIVTNASESAVNNRAIRRLHAAWSAHRTEGIQLTALTGLPLSHDIVEPLRNPAVADRVYPQLLALVEGDDA